MSVRLLRLLSKAGELMTLKDSSQALSATSTIGKEMSKRLDLPLSFSRSNTLMIERRKKASGNHLLKTLIVLRSRSPMDLSLKLLQDSY
jgi:hypothetical protein